MAETQTFIPIKGSVLLPDDLSIIGKRNTLTVKLHVKEILYNIENIAFVTGRSREMDKSAQYEAASNMQISEDAENSYQMRRSIASAFSRIKTEFGEYLNAKTTSTDNTLQDEIDNDGTLILGFILPSNYNSASADAVGKSLHEYLVDMAVADWFQITNKPDAADYINKAGIAMENAKRALYRRSRPTRPVISDT